MYKKNFIPYQRKQLLTVAGAGIVFMLTAFGVYLTQGNPLGMDRAITKITQNLVGRPQMDYQGNFLNDVFTFLATYGDATPLVLLTVLFSIVLFIRHYHFLALWFSGVVASGGVVGAILKINFSRMRPVGHLPEDNGGSFPSGHSIGSTLVFFTILVVFLPKIKNAFVRHGLQVLVMLIWLGILGSRLYFSAHHFTDILAGVSFGIFWVSGAMAVYGLTASWFCGHFFKKSLI